VRGPRPTVADVSGVSLVSRRLSRLSRQGHARLRRPAAAADGGPGPSLSAAN